MDGDHDTTLSSVKDGCVTSNSGPRLSLPASVWTRDFMNLYANNLLYIKQTNKFREDVGQLSRRQFITFDQLLRDLFLNIQATEPQLRNFG